MPVYRKFLLAFAATSLLLLALTLATNIYVDPLWYRQGNTLAEGNLPFNERQTKLNRLWALQQKPDCLIFGSSRFTLLRAADFRGWNCFNLSFSGGKISEILIYARYLKHQGFEPKLIIVGLDIENFETKEQRNSLPAFIQAGEPPPSMLASYLSADSLLLSLRALKGQPEYRRYYDRDFNGRVMASAGHFTPPQKTQKITATYPLEAKNAAPYAELAAVFPNAVKIGVVPPMSPWYLVRKLDRPGNLTNYEAALEYVGQRFPTLYDFSLPSVLTLDAKASYDGIHYRPEIYQKIAEIMVEGRVPSHVSLATPSLHHHANRCALRAFLASGATDAPALAEDLAVTPAAECAIPLRAL